jgi:hypothetical protein
VTGCLALADRVCQFAGRETCQFVQLIFSLAAIWTLAI